MTEMPARLFILRSFSLAQRWLSSPCFHICLCVCPSVYVCVQVYSFCMNINHTGLGSTLMTWLHLERHLLQIRSQFLGVRTSTYESGKRGTVQPTALVEGQLDGIFQSVEEPSKAIN